MQQVNSNPSTASNAYSDSVTQSAVNRFFSHSGIVNNERLKAKVDQGFLSAAVVGENFIVYAQDQRTANEVLAEAQKLRKSLAQEWLGKELPAWKEPLVIGVFDHPTKGAEGSTTFSITPTGKQFSGCIVEGTRQRIMDSVLPHELTHAVLTSHFPTKYLPRWADEGAATFVEHSAETRKHDANLVQHLQTNRGISFNDMFSMTEYPKDMLPLYSQGHSLTKFLVQKGEEIEQQESDNVKLSGKQRFVKFLEKGMEGNSNEGWVAAVQEYYKYDKLGTLQTTWNKWVENSVNSQSATNNIASNGPKVREPESQLDSGDLVLPAKPKSITPAAEIGSLASNSGGLFLGNPKDPAVIASTISVPSRTSFPSRNPYETAQAGELMLNSSDGKSFELPPPRSINIGSLASNTSSGELSLGNPKNDRVILPTVAEPSRTSNPSPRPSNVSQPSELILSSADGKSIEPPFTSSITIGPAAASPKGFNNLSASSSGPKLNSGDGRVIAESLEPIYIGGNSYDSNTYVPSESGAGRFNQGISVLEIPQMNSSVTIGAPVEQFNQVPIGQFSQPSPAYISNPGLPYGSLDIPVAPAMSYSGGNVYNTATGVVVSQKKQFR